MERTDYDKAAFEDTEDGRLAARYLPELLFDEAEPFYPYAAGITVFRGREKSPSCRRTVDPGFYKAGLAIEYAWYYDYDIQHLYDLEHIWVYVGADGRVCGVENSFHGKFLSAMVPGFPVVGEDGRVRLYVQPGKHAFLPDPALFHVYIGFEECCNVEAGGEGIITPDIIPGMIRVSGEQKERMARYIRMHYGFTPTERYRSVERGVLLLPWKELAAQIPARMTAQLERIGEKVLPQGEKEYKNQN